MEGSGARRTGPSRRELIVAGSASALALTAGVGVTAPPVEAAGIVFDDRSETGRRRPGDPGIPGVMVSNGRDVVVTDAEGRWRLPLAEGESVFVVKPPGWATPTGPGGVPRFSYLHQPGGTPRDLACRYAGVAPTGPLPNPIELPLRRRPEPRRFDVLLAADTQPENATELAYLRDDIVSAMLGRGAAFGINHGDIVGDDLSLYPRYLEVLGATGIPWHHCPGNHDMNLEAHSDRFSRETWKRVFGPRHYAFQHAGATFILLDNVHYFGRVPGTPRSGRYCGLIGADQLAFVAGILARVPADRLVVLCMHIPLRTYQDPANPADNTADCAALLRLLAGRPHCVSFSGHMHLIEHHYLAAGTETGAGPRHHHHVLAAGSGSWWSGPRDYRGLPSADCPDGSPNGFHVLSVDGSHYAAEFVPAVRKGADRLRILIDGPHRRDRGPAARLGAVPHAPIPVSALPACEVVVNVFDGGPRTQVVCEMAGAGASPLALQRAAVADPFIATLFAQHPETLKPWVAAVPSSHLWKGPLPRGLSPGAHCLTVRARNEFGVEHTAHVVLEVTA